MTTTTPDDARPWTCPPPTPSPRAAPLPPSPPSPGLALEQALPALPPGVPDSAVATLRAAYDKMNADPGFSAALQKRRLRLMASSGARVL